MLHFRFELGYPTKGAASRYDDLCVGRTRTLPQESELAAPTIAELPVDTADPHELRLRNYGTIQFAPDFGLETISVDPYSTSILSLVGSHRADVDLDDLSVIRSSKLIDGGSFSYAVVDDRTIEVIAAEWCGGTYRFRADGPTRLVFSSGEKFVACGPIAMAADVLWILGDDRFIGIDAEGDRHEVAFTKSVTTGTVRDLIRSDQDRLVALIEPEGGTPQLVRLDAKSRSVTTVDAPGLIGPVVTGSDGAVWGATRGAQLVREDGTTAVDITFPDLGRVTSMTVDAFGRLWFTTRTAIGMATADGTVRFKAIPGAEGLSDIVFVRMGDFLAVLDSSTNTLIRFSMSER